MRKLTDVSNILNGSENLSLETVSKEQALNIPLICPRTGEGRVKQIIEGAVSRKKGYA
jgi:hypothetical protein